ncbi:hypothetical protein B9Z19DRAFT_94607 [Tuber borchii]|uniref:Uncharacterized protein n=1 Tax=Tuber borchii TaxID=42251 RepID=A0A2T6ZRT9_TUBBO|nr:hypothetical protein B9Z19DRAFT_94607 [Tuber borchii]
MQRILGTGTGECSRCPLFLHRIGRGRGTHRVDLDRTGNVTAAGVHCIFFSFFHFFHFHFPFLFSSLPSSSFSFACLHASFSPFPLLPITLHYPGRNHSDIHTTGTCIQYTTS